MQKLLIILGRPFTFVIQTILIVALFVTKLLLRINRIKLHLPKVHFRLPRLPRLPQVRFPHFSPLKPHLSFRVKRSVIEKSIIFLSISVVLLALSYFIRLWLLALPSPTLLQNPPSLTTRILDRNGTLLYQLFRDENRTLVKLADLPPYIKEATLAIEDKNFYHHAGLDFTGILRALGKNIVNCRFYTKPCIPEGGSTLTQQLIKNTLLSPKKSLDRKLKEAVLAIWAERIYSKDQILELYLNEVSYGGTAYGIQAASEYYFDKGAKDLTLSEAALLAGLTTSPTTLSPLGSRPYLAKDRQILVLQKMFENGYISESQKIEATQTPLAIRPKKIDIQAPHFVMWLREQLVSEYGEDLIAQGGLTITTTLDLNTQNILENAINQELTRLHNLKVSNAAGLVTNPSTGEILAMVGSHDYYDYEHDGQVNITTSPRQPGSSIKPITYSLALMRGLSGGSTIEDTPICFNSKGSPPYCPKNYDGRFHGTVTLRTALASSYNIPAVKLLNSVGISNMINLARSMGITTWDDPSRFGLALTLGSGEVRMVDMAEVYGTLANYGTHVPLRSIISIQDSKGNFLKSSEADKLISSEVVPPAVAFQINSILSDNNARAPAFGTNSVLNIPKNQVAVKTGTTNSLRDNWTFGYTKDLLVATWVGNNNNTPMSAVASGITGASPIWRHTIETLLDKNKPNIFNPPEGVRKIALCKETKSVYCKDICPSAPVYEYFSQGAEPKGTCDQQKNGTLLPDGATSK